MIRKYAEMMAILRYDYQGFFWGEAKGNSSLQEKWTKEQNIFIGEITAILFSPGRHKKSEFKQDT